MNSLFLIFGLGGQEIFFVFVIVLLLFGGNKIPELMRGLGKGIKEFNSARANVEDELRKGMEEPEKKKVESN
jgi:sec-independent protein translocase protein TatA